MMAAPMSMARTRRSARGARQATGGTSRRPGRARVGLTAWLGRQVSRWARAQDSDSRAAFDGESLRAAASTSAAAPNARVASPGLSRTRGRVDRVVNDNSIPTPRAAREVRKIRQEQGTPLWVKVVAPLSLVSAVVAAVSYGAAPVITLAAGLIVSVLAHEVAHIGVLHRLGDRTAEEAGSHSLNPFHHIDPLKTVILPALTLALSSMVLPFPILMGAGKAVDADFNNLRGPFGGPRSARNALCGGGRSTNLLLAVLTLLPGGVRPWPCR
jgi:hypothetical protein